MGGALQSCQVITLVESDKDITAWRILFSEQVMKGTVRSFQNTFLLNLTVAAKFDHSTLFLNSFRM